MTSDTRTYRYHSEPCEHGRQWDHPVPKSEAVWVAAGEAFGHCPGGREVTLKRVRADDWYRTEDVPDHIEAVVNVGQSFDGFVYLEVPE